MDGQTILAVLLVAAAAAYLMRRLWARWRPAADETNGCAGCPASCGMRHPRPRGTPGRGGPAQKS